MQLLKTSPWKNKDQTYGCYKKFVGVFKKIPDLVFTY